MTRSTLLLTAALLCAAPAVGRADAAATTPYEVEVTCTIADTANACEAAVPVPAGNLLTVQTITALRTGSPSGSEGVVFNTTFGGKQSTFALPLMPDPSGLPVDAATLTATIYTHGGKGTALVAYRSAFSGAETVEFGVSGFLTPNS